jgi:hypothetical protein
MRAVIAFSQIWNATRSGELRLVNENSEFRGFRRSEYALLHESVLGHKADIASTFLMGSDLRTRPFRPVGHVCNRCGSISDSMGNRVLDGSAVSCIPLR